MDLGTIGIIIFGAIAGVALIFLLIALSPPPLYGPPEKNSSTKAEPPDSHKPSR